MAFSAPVPGFASLQRWFVLTYRVQKYSDNNQVWACGNHTLGPGKYFFEEKK
jgi:hypothetical protein